MDSTMQAVLQFVEENDVKFIRLAFCDVMGTLKNIAIMPQELKRAFSQGISFDGSAVRGFSGVEESDLFLFPIPETLTDLPWRPSGARWCGCFAISAIPMGGPTPWTAGLCWQTRCGRPEKRESLCRLARNSNFYLFKTDADGNPTTQPFDHAGYMDVAPEDEGENVRREICLMLDADGHLSGELPPRERPGTKRDRLPVFGPPRGCRQRRHLPRDGSHRGGAERALRQLFPQAAGGL